MIPLRNMLSDGNGWFYAWNAENRMVLASNAAHTVTYAYDHMGRMIVKELSEISDNYKLTTKNFLWDAYNIIRETAISPSPIPSATTLPPSRWTGS